MKTKILVVGDNNTLLHTKLLDVLEGHPEYLVIYVNEDNLDTIDGMGYDAIICDELVDLGVVPICPTGHELMFDRLPDLGYTPVNTKHVSHSIIKVDGDIQCEYTGYDASMALCEHINNRLTHCTVLGYYVHSKNPIGSQNIRNCLGGVLSNLN